MTIETHTSRIVVGGARGSRQMQAGGEGRALQGIGGEMTAFALAKREADNNAALARAKLTYQERLADLDGELNRDTYYGTHESRFNGAAVRMRDELAGTLPQSARDSFNLQADGLALAGRTRVRDRAFGRERDANRADLQGRLDTLTRTSAQAGNDADRRVQVNAGLSAIEDMARAGWISAQEAQARAQQLTQDSARAYGQRLVDENPHAALDMLGAPTQASATLLDAVRQAESAGNPNAVSPKGAQGAYQVMPETAKNPGFGVKPLADAFDEKEARRFARDYLNAMLRRYDGDVEAALIAYNAGAGNADKWLAAGRDYATLPKRRETEPYVAKILGLAGGGEIAGLDDGDRRALRRAARAEIDRRDREAQAEREADERDLAARVKDIGALVDAGYAPDAQMIGEAKGIAARLGNADAVAALDFTGEIAWTVDAVQKLPPQQGEAYLAELEGRASRNATPKLAAEIKAVEAALKRQDKGLADDPLGYAASVGAIELKPLDLSANPAGAFAERASLARTVAARYGNKVQYFTPSETADLARAFDEGDASARVRMAGAIAQGFGADAHKAFAEMAQTSPAMAHLGGLALTGAQGGLSAREAFDGMQLLKDKIEPPGKPDDYAQAARQTLGGAIPSEMTGQRSAIEAAAKAIYASRANRAGITEFSADLFAASIEAALGARIGERHGAKFVLPPGITQGWVDKALGRLDDAQLVTASRHGGAPVSAEGKAASADNVRDGYLVSVGPGLYRVSASDPATRAQYLLDGATGAYYVIDLNGVEPAERGPKRASAGRGAAK